MSSQADNAGPQAVLDFWFGDGLVLGWPSAPRGALWFGGGAALDADIRGRFGALVTQAVDGGLTGWEADVRDRLALVILLDQFTRNVFRGEARAFAGDARAHRLATDTLAQREDALLPLVGRVFIAMPLMHAEDGASQAGCVRHFEQLRASCGPAQAEALQGHLDAAIEHQTLITTYGRFPHRNAVLGRTSSPQERAYLENGRRFGQ